MIQLEPTQRQESFSAPQGVRFPLATVPETIDVVACPLPFATAGKLYVLPAGMTITEVVGQIVPKQVVPLSIKVYIGPDYIPEELWGKIRIKPGNEITINFVPRGGGGKKNPLAAILALVVAVTAAYLGPVVAGALGFIEGSAGFAVASALTSAAVSAVGGLLINAIAPPPSPKLSSNKSQAESPTLFIQGARNDARLYGRIPVPLGRHRYVPPLGALNYTESVDDAQYVRQLFCYGYGKFNIYERRIGETLLTEFKDVETAAVLDGTSESSDLTLYPNAVFQEQLSVQLLNTAGWSTRTTQPNADEIIVDINFPRGLVRYDAEGNKKRQTVEVEIQYAPTGTSSWSTSHIETFSLATTSAVLRSVRFSGITNDTYDVRIRRLTGDSNSDKIFDESWWTALKTVTYENPVIHPGLSLEAMRIRASDQLSGAVDQYNVIYFSILPDWDVATQTWIERETNNPASIYRYALQNAGTLSNIGPNAIPLPDNRMDLIAVQEWHEYCKGKNLTYNSVIDYEANLWDLLHEIAAAGHAVPAVVDNKWSIIIEREQSVARQHFNPVNSWGYRGDRVFTKVPHGFRVLFLNEDKGFIQDERIVYDDGYTKDNATNIQELKLPGVTNSDAVYVQARRYIAILKRRRVVHSFYTSVEHLKCPRGSLVKFAHDVPLIGLGWGYVTKVILDSGNITHLYLDRNVEMEFGKSYSITFRSNSNATVTQLLVTVPGETNLVQVQNPFPVTDLTASVDPEEFMDEDILFSFGITGKETIDGIVKAVIPRDDLTAQIFLVDAAPEIFTSDTEVIPDHVSTITLPADMSRPIAPVIMSVQTGAEVQVVNLDGSISTRMVITLRNYNLGEVVPVVKIKSSGETSMYYPTMLSASATKVVLEGLDPGTRYDLEVYYKRIHTSETTGLLNNQMSLPAIESNILFLGVEGPPADITGLVLQVVGSTAVLQWDRHLAIDLDHYEIRFTPNIVDPTWGSAAVYRDKWYVESITIPLQLGTYLVKAFDKQGQPSDNAALVSTDLTSIAGLDILERIDEHPSFAGSKTNVVIDGGTGNLELDDITVPEGIYYYNNSIDLGDVFTSVLTPIVVVAGRSSGDTMDSWPTLDTLGFLSGDVDSGWSVVHEIRYTNDDPGGTPVWSDWVEVHVGEYTFRAVQGRIKLYGNGSTITPTIEELSLIVNMPDRIVKGNDATLNTGTKTITYDTGFYETPTIVVTIKDQQAGDVLLVTNETATGFDVEVTNAAANVIRSITYHAIGYGSVQ